jgi:RPA family protein
MTGREPAWRVTAAEFQSSLLEEKGTGPREAGYVLSPSGSRMNRVLLAGILGPGESIGKDPAAPFLRGRLTDPTGTVSLTAGSYQPRALHAYLAVREARPALVVGKAHLFTGRDGTVHPSVRAEALRPLGEEEYRLALADVAEQTLDRLDLLEALRAGRRPDAATPPAWVLGAERANEQFPSFDPRGLREVVRNLVESLGGPPVAPPPRPESSVRITRAPPPVAPAPAPSAAVRAEEAAFLDILDELAERSADGYADLKDALEVAEQRGVRRPRAEELLNGLEESGVLEEPVVGKIRRA